MKNVIKYLAVVCCFTLGTTLAHADSHGHDGVKSKHDSGHDSGHEGKKHANMLKHADTDNDGAISKSEFDAAHNEHFKKMDADNDGKLTADEKKAGHQKSVKKNMISIQKQLQMKNSRLQQLHFFLLLLWMEECIGKRK